MDFQVEPLNNNVVIPPTPRPFFGMQLFKSTERLLAFVGILAVIGLILLFFFIDRNNFSEKSIEAKIDGPTQVTSGELVTYKVLIDNKSAVDIDNTRLDFIYPRDAVVLKDNTAELASKESISLGTIPKQTSRTQTFSAIIVGDQGNVKTARAVLTYRPRDLTSDFQSSAEFATTISHTAVPITVTAPPTVVDGQKLQYIIDYRNQSTETFNDLRLVIGLSDDFSATKYEPRFDENTSDGQINSKTWLIPTLEPGARSRIIIEGIIHGNEREQKTITAVLQKKITTETGEQYVDFERSQSDSLITIPFIVLSANINDQQDYVAHVNDTLRYKITVRNDSEYDLNDLKLTAKLVGDMYDLSTVNSEGYFDSRESTVIWDTSSIPQLGSLETQRSVTIPFSVKLKSAFRNGGSGISDSLVQVRLHIETTNIPNNLSLDTIAADGEFNTSISTKPVFTQQLLVNDPQLGPSGPFSPRVDQKTVFTIHWTAINPSNNVRPAKVIAELEPGVVWNGNSRTNDTSPAPVYDSRLKTITWNIGTLGGGAGVSNPPAESFFQIAVTPSINQVGFSVPLLKNVRFEGVDAITQEKLNMPVSNIDTSSVSDSEEDGSVQQP